MKRIVLSLLMVFVMAGFVFAQANTGAQNKNSNNGAYYNCPYPDCPLCTGGFYGPKAGKGGKGMANLLIVVCVKCLIVTPSKKCC